MPAIEKILASLDVPSDPALVSSLQIYSEEIIKWNRRVNLTGASTVEDFVNGPLFDALTILKVLQKGGSLVDVGSGGGLPGIPAALAYPEIKVTLVEPRSKRASFLRHVAHRLGISAEISEVREDKLPGNSWSGAVAQAVWPPQEWLSKANRLVEPGGAIYVLSSRPVLDGELPDGILLEQAETCERASDNKTRFVTLFRTSRK